MTAKNISDKFLAESRADIQMLVANANEPWRQSWTIAPPLFARNAKTGRHYQGGNRLRLMLKCLTAGYSQPIFATYKQIQDLGGQVRKGEHGTLIAVVCSVLADKEEAQGEEEHSTARKNTLVRGATVFNIAQADGLEGLFAQAPAPDMADIVKDLLQSHAPKIIFGEPAYSRRRDVIEMPRIDQFKNDGAYYHSLLHELSHWTMHESRLNRNFDYLTEEFIADISAFMLCSLLALPFEPRDVASYLKNWSQLTDKPLEAIYDVAFPEVARVLNYLLAPVDHLVNPEPAKGDADALESAA